MSFLPAVHREIANRPPQDPVRVTLEFFEFAAGDTTRVAVLDRAISARVLGWPFRLITAGFSTRR